MKKVLAFFGAFNPPTKAHIDLAKLAMEQTGMEGVVFIPSKSTYILNDQKKSFAFSDEERVDMLYEIRRSNSWMDFITHDMISEKQPCSYETLRWLRGAYNYQPSLLVGADQFARMEDEWKHVEEIAKEFGIVCMPRYLFHRTEGLLKNVPFYQKIAPYVTLVKVPYEYEYNPISSSRARAYLRVIQEGLEDLRNAVPPEIYVYIKEKYV